MWIVSAGSRTIFVGSTESDLLAKESAEKCQFNHNKSLVDDIQNLDKTGREIYAKLMPSIKSFNNMNIIINTDIYQNFIELLIDHLSLEVKATIKLVLPDGLYQDSMGNPIVKLKGFTYSGEEIYRKCQSQGFSDENLLKYNPAKEGK